MKVNASKYILLFILLIFTSIYNVSSQYEKIGYPFLKNFSRSEYQAGLQSWMISQTSNGIMYFANNVGLMEFDGMNWNLYPLPTKSIVRSIYIDESERIYIGTFNDLGYFENNEIGSLEYFSIKHLIPEGEREFGEIWRIFKTDEGIVFQSYEQLMIYSDDKIKLINAPNLFHFSYYIKDKLYITDNDLGIYEYHNKELTFLDWSSEFQGKEISSIIENNGNLLISTTDYGVWQYDGESLSEWDSNILKDLKKNQIYCALRIDYAHIAFGTIQDGLFICTNKGVPVFKLNEEKGLQNNTILCMSKDVENNLWLGTDNGIDLLMLNLPLSQMNKKQNLSAGYTAIIHNEYLYLGTNRGLYYKKWEDCTKYPSRLSDFKYIEKLKGQVWKLQIIDNVLFCGHNNGAYIIDGLNSKKISDIQGAWMFIKPREDSDKIIGGTYTGLVLYEKINGEWKFIKRISGYDESSRIMELKDDELWVSHVDKGVYRLRFNEDLDSITDVDFFDESSGFKYNYGINVTKLNDEIVFFSPHGIYSYDEKLKKMIRSEKYKDFFPEDNVINAKEDKYGDIWYFTEKNVGVMRQLEDASYKEIRNPFKPLEGKFINAFQFVFPIDEKHAVFGYENGFIHYEQDQKKYDQKPFNVFINRVLLSRTDSVLISGHVFKKPEKDIVLTYKNNSLHFFFSAVNYDYPEKIKFSTFLKGYDKVWSDWEYHTDREFTNLKEGSYEFHLKAKNIYDIETDTLVFEFIIDPPWHRTTLAIVFYIVLILLFLFLLITIIIKRFEKQKKREDEAQKKMYLERERKLQRETLIAEKEIIKLRNEKLREQMKSKSKELADSTMQQIQKNKFLINIKSTLSKISTGTQDDYVKSKIKNVLKKIDSDINNEDNWKIFETHFTDVHEKFLKRLKNEYPEISPAELRLCACLRMNISTKEIASLLNISVRGVEAGRYRLRKTLKLDRKTNLTDFILSI